MRAASEVEQLLMYKLAKQPAIEGKGLPEHWYPIPYAEAQTLHLEKFGAC